MICYDIRYYTNILQYKQTLFHPPTEALLGEDGGAAPVLSATLPARGDGDMSLAQKSAPAKWVLSPTGT